MNARIIVCDDDAHISLAVSMKLERAGFDVERFCNGAEAWAAIERHPPDLVVTDWQMPRMGGEELCRSIQACAHTAGLPIIALTGKAMELDPRLVESLGISRLVNKPFSPRELLNHVEAVIASGARTA